MLDINVKHEVYPDAYPTEHYTACKFFINNSAEVVMSEDKFNDYFRGRKYYMSHTNRGESKERVPRSLEYAKARQEFLRVVDVSAVDFYGTRVPEEDKCNLRWGKQAHGFDRARKIGNVVRVVHTTTSTLLFYSVQVFEAWMRTQISDYGITELRADAVSLNRISFTYNARTDKQVENGETLVEWTTLIPVAPEETCPALEKMDIVSIYRFRKDSSMTQVYKTYADYFCGRHVENRKVYNVTCDVVTTLGSLEY